MDLRKLMEPEVVAVFGLSMSNPFNPANVIYHKNHLRYRARTYGLNLRGGSLFGERIYTRLADLPEQVDLAVLCVRAEFVPAALRQCIDAGVGGAIIISGGFAESGRGDLQAEITRLSREHAFPVIGPNCIGVFSPPHTDTFFLPHERLVEPKVGGVGLVSQSGGMLVDMITKLTQEGAGLSRAVSIGNKAALDEVDLLAFLRDDPSTRAIGVYLEGFQPGRGRDFVELMGTMDKPVVVFKAGKTPGGSRAVSSHTASIAGDYRVFRDVVARSGAIEAHTEGQFVAYCEALASQRCCTTRHVAIVTASGGHGAIASDGCSESGLDLVEFSAEDQASLRDQLSPRVQPIASVANPIDLTGSADDNDFLAATRFALEHEAVDCVLLLLLPYLPGISPHIGARIAQCAREAGKPIVTYIPHVEKYGIFIEGFEINGVPVAHSVEGTVYMARALGRRTP